MFSQSVSQSIAFSFFLSFFWGLVVFHVQLRTISQVEQLLGRRHVCRDGYIGLFGLSNLEQLLCESIGVVAGASSVGQLRLGRHRGGAAGRGEW